MKGKFIAIEGIDASGKETISIMLARELKAKRYAFPYYRSPIGQLIHDHLSGYWGTTLTPQDDALVFQALQTANRLEYAHSIQAYLEMGRTVVADRYLASSLAYGGSDGLDTNYLHELQRFLPQPDFNFLLDIPVEESFRRRPDRSGDRYEEDRAKLEDVRIRYLRLFQGRTHDDPWRWKVIDGTQTPEQIMDKILETIR